MLDPKTKLPITPDLLTERLIRLKSDFPDLFTAEWSLDLASLQSLTSETPDHREHYRFEWAGKHESKRLAFTPSTARLQYDESRSIHPDQAKGNMIIEWDNLEVLKLLTSAYRGAVKCIYIDPPYNTGKDFVYSDNYTEGKEAYWNKSGQVAEWVRVDTNTESNGRYHSDWLSMMHSRLLLARGLLKNEGVIFVSIDDNEVHNLRKLMDDVFGEDNFMWQMVWHARGRSKTALSIDHEYILVYAKSLSMISPIFKPTPGVDINWYWEYIERKYSNPDNDVRWDWRDAQHTVTEKKAHYTQSINRYTWEITKWEVINNIEWYGHNTWMYPPTTVKNLFDDNRLLFTEQKGSTLALKVKKFQSEEESVTALAWLIERDVISSRHWSEEFDEFMWANIFDYPKPTELLKKLYSACTKNEDLILDFFAWSGTTGQAVMELNKEDGGNRQYILVQLPELTSEESEAYRAGYRKISDITIKRNKRVIGWYGDHPTPIDWVGFRVFTLARSAFPRVDFTPDATLSETENLALLEDYIARKEAVFHLETHAPGVMEEVLLKNGFRLDYTLTKVDAITGNTVYLATDTTGLSAYITLDRPISPDTVTYFQAHTDKRFICLEQALDTTAKWNLRTALRDLFVAY